MIDYPSLELQGPVVEAFARVLEQSDPEGGNPNPDPGCEPWEYFADQARAVLASQAFHTFLTEAQATVIEKARDEALAEAAAVADAYPEKRWAGGYFGMVATTPQMVADAIRALPSSPPRAPKERTAPEQQHRDEVDR